MMNYYGFRMMRPVIGFPEFGWIFGIIFWILFILLIVGLVRWYMNSHEEGSDKEEEKEGESALSILKKRYAKGEITLKEFERMKKDIS